MPNWLLRWIPGLRALEIERSRLRETVGTLTQDNLRLQDRLDAALQDRTRLWDMTQECLQGERTSYQMHINMSVQRQGGGIPYPDAPHLPPASVPREQSHEPVGRKGRVLPSEMIQQRANEYVDQLFSSTEQG